MKIHDQICPHCGSDQVDAHFVDIGVGLQQASPFHCLDCLAHQFYDRADATDATPEEQAVGWFKGPDLSGVAGQVPALPAGGMPLVR